MPTYNVQQYYLGNFSELDTVEATDGPGTNSESDNEYVNATNTGGGTNLQSGAVFGKTELKMTQIQQNDTVREGATNRLEEDDYAGLSPGSGLQLGADSFTYDLGSGPVTSDIDSIFLWNVTVLLGDGTTVPVVLSMVQLANGDVFTNTNTGLDNLNVQSITFDSPFSNYSQYYGTSHSRSIENGRIVCFAAGTMIQTEQGEVAIEDLVAGDMVQTLDNGLQPLRWIGSRKLDAIDLAVNAALRPIRIRAGSLGQDLPVRDLRVSPQHRILIDSDIARRMFGTPEVLAAAKQFVMIDGIDIDREATEVVYYHMLFDQHEIVYSDGALTESLFTGPVAMETLSQEARDEIRAIMPEALEAGEQLEAARPLLSGRLARKLASRHVQNRKPLIAHH